MIRRFRIFFWFIKAYLVKYYKVIVFSLILGTSAFYFSSNFSHLIPQPQKDTRIGIIGRYTTDNLPLLILKKISRGLVKINADGSVSPDLAESWRVEEEGRVYIFRLKKNLDWQDGTAIKAQDIYCEIENVETKSTGDLSLEFKLKEPFSPFLTLLDQPLFKKSFLGVSGHRVSSIKTSGKFVLFLKLENENSIIYKFYPTERAAILGFKLGELDELMSISDPSDLQNWSNVEIVHKLQKDQFVAVFNTKDPLFSSKKVRQALTYAIKKPVDDSRVLGPINPNSWAYNSQVKDYEHNQLKSKELLNESNVENAEIELSTTFSQLNFAEKIKKSWEEIGIKTNIRVVSTVPENYQAFLASQEIPTDPDQYTLWHSTQRTNITGYNNPRVDKLLEDARKLMDKEERKAKYLDFQRFLVEDSPAAFLFHPTIYSIIRES